MKTLTSIQDFLKSSPSKDEIEKVLNLINRMNFSKVRREIWEKERQLRKLEMVDKKLKEISIPVPPDILSNLKVLKSEIEDLRKGLPIIKKREKK